MGQFLVEITASSGSVFNGNQQEGAIEKLQGFIQKVIKQEDDVMRTRTNMECMVRWTEIVEKADIDFREAIGAPSSKTILGQDTKEKPPVAKPAASVPQINSPQKSVKK